MELQGLWCNVCSQIVEGCGIPRIPGATSSYSFTTVRLCGDDKYADLALAGLSQRRPR